MTRKRDLAEKETDEMIDELEERIKKEYSSALEGVKKKYDKYSKKFEKEDEAQRQKVAEGKMTEESYKQWRVIHLYNTERFKHLAETLASDLAKADEKAMSIVNGYLPDAYALNFNYSTYDIEKNTKVNTSFTLYSRETVEKMMRDDPKLLPKGKVDIPKDKLWNKQHINSAILQGVLQGDSIDSISDRLQLVTDMDRKAAIRNARTMMTGAQNSGRIDAYNRAESLGIKIQKEWMSTLDKRTRDSHRALDGERVECNDKFSNGLKFPGDPDGDPSEVYNCRCTMVPFYPEYADLMQSRVTYDEWAKSREFDDKFKVINGKDISGTWERRPELFDFEIEDVMNAQGFDGLPRVVTAEEFDECVKRANGGNGFIAQRTYSAPDQETLDAYRDQLYNGKWYVDCSTGGAQYGQGMYCAADYTGKLTDGIKTEMEHYKSMYFEDLSHSEAVNIAKEKAENQIKSQAKSYIVDKFHPYIDGYDFDQGKWKPDFMETAKALKEENPALYGKIFGQIKSYEEKYDNVVSSIKMMNTNEIGIQYNFSIRKEMLSYTETLTLDPSAKIISYNDLREIKNGVITQEEYEKLKEEAFEEVLRKRNASEYEEILARDFSNMINTPEQREAWEKLDEVEDMSIAEWKSLRKSASSIEKEYYELKYSKEKQLREEREELAKKYSEFEDMGSLATALGYDAINAEGHGQSSSYTVILNRTKVIIREDK